MHSPSAISSSTQEKSWSGISVHSLTKKRWKELHAEYMGHHKAKLSDDEMLRALLKDVSAKDLPSKEVIATLAR